MVNYLALLVALMLSGVSAYYSVIGLTTIFASAFLPIVLMGGTLEVAKLVTASWLYNNWNVAPRLIRYYLTTAVIVLMFITSMGIFGFLSKAHIEQSLTINTGTADQIAIIKTKIDFEKQAIEDLDRQIIQIDNAVNKLTDRNQAATSVRVADQQRKNRESFVKRKEDHVKNISVLTEQRIRLESEIKKLEAEVGPLKYISELIYDLPSTENLERSVRMVILLLVSVFDPLAVVLLIAANIGLKKNNSLTKLERPGILKISDEILGENDVVERKTH